MTDTQQGPKGPGVPLYTARNVEGTDGWAPYRKTRVTLAKRIAGPFLVQTSESGFAPFYCEDGYLAIDARGYPYAIAADEFALIYERVPDVQSADLG